MSTHIHIERLVLEGIQVDRAGNVQRGLERELARLVREGGLVPEVRRSTALPELRAGSVAVGRGAQGARFATRLASAVYRGLGGHK